MFSRAILGNLLGPFVSWVSRWESTERWHFLSLELYTKPCLDTLLKSFCDHDLDDLAIHNANRIAEKLRFHNIRAIRTIPLKPVFRKF